MRIVRCSGRLLGGGGVSAWGVVSAHGGLPGGGVCQTPHPPPDRILDTRLWKHNLSATTVADGNKSNSKLTR